MHLFLGILVFLVLAVIYKSVSTFVGRRGRYRDFD